MLIITSPYLRHFNFVQFVSFFKLIFRSRQNSSSIFLRLCKYSKVNSQLSLVNKWVFPVCLIFIKMLTNLFKFLHVAMGYHIAEFCDF